MKQGSLNRLWLLSLPTLLFSATANANSDAGYTFKLSGQIMYDVTQYQIHEQGDAQDGVRINERDVRRARLSARGDLNNHWQYNVSLNVANALNNTPDEDPIELWQAYVSYQLWSNGKLKLGQYVEPFGLENATSSLSITFMERGLPYALTPIVGQGAGIAITPNKYIFAEVGVFTRDVNANANLSSAATGRIAFAPIQAKGRLIHLGLNYSEREPEQDEVRYRTTPEADFAPTLFSSGTLSDVQSITLNGIEGAIVIGSASLQAEYISAELHRNIKESRQLESYYVYTSYVVTGETRPYQNGRFKSIKPKSRWGAWELALRYSEINDNEQRKLNTLTFGMNSYINQHLRLMFNYIHAQKDHNDNQSQADVYQMRLQANF